MGNEWHVICNNEINEVSKSEKNCSIKIEVELSRWRPENTEGKGSPKILGNWRWELDFP